MSQALEMRFLLSDADWIAQKGYLDQLLACAPTILPDKTTDSARAKQAALRSTRATLSKVWSTMLSGSGGIVVTDKATCA